METHVSELTYLVQHHLLGLIIVQRVLKNTESSVGVVIDVVHTSIV